MAATEVWPLLSPHHADTGPGPGGGEAEAQQVKKPSYSGIASINKSVRDKKNILEVRLERTTSTRFHLSMIEIEGLLKKLGIDNSHFLGVSSCPEGKGVIYVTLHPSVDVN